MSYRRWGINEEAYYYLKEILFSTTDLLNFNKFKTIIIIIKKKLYTFFLIHKLSENSYKKHNFFCAHKKSWISEYYYDAVFSDTPRDTQRGNDFFLLICKNVYFVLFTYLVFLQFSWRFSCNFGTREIYRLN